MQSKSISRSLLALIFLVGVFAMPLLAASGDDVDVLIATSKPYDGMIAKIHAVGGTVRFQYKHADGIAATIPRDKLTEIQKLPEVKYFGRDFRFTIEEPYPVERAGYGKVSGNIEISADQISAGNVAEFTSAAPDGYYPTEVDIMRASDFWGATGHFGENVIVGIMDTGTANVAAIAGRVLGGESFLPANPPLDDGLSANSPANDPHGTWVASTVGANIIFGFFSTSTLVKSLKLHIPEAVLPDYFGAGIDGVPMVGPAPFANFYALKIFNRFGQTSTSIILAAFDRAIELKTLYNNGDPSGVNLQVINGSFSGPTLFAANDPFFAAMVSSLTDVGIVTVFSASNDGPSGMTGGDPGLARHTLTAGATNIASYEKVLRDLQYGLGIGDLYRANDTHQTAYFSSRGPTADGRVDPDITAPGFAIFAQGASGGLSIVSGTSFSAPNTAGCAALLLSAHPGATPAQIRGALLAGANPYALGDNSGAFDQGFGLVNVLKAHYRFGAHDRRDRGLETPDVDTNIHNVGPGVKVVESNNYARSTGWLLPGERFEFFVDINYKIRGVHVTVNVTPQLPFDQQNQLFGDDALVTIHSAKTSSWGDYRVFSFVPGAATFDLGEQDLEFGLMRVTINGDWTNAGKIKADVLITMDNEDAEVDPIASGFVTQGEFDGYLVTIPAGLPELDLALVWQDDWGRWPTDDLDLLIYDPNGDLVIVDNDGDLDADGLSADSPERVFLYNPIGGTYTIFVNGFTVWSGSEEYTLYAGAPGLFPKALASNEEVSALPTSFAVSQNYPNPFNPSTQIAFQLPDPSRVTIDIFDIRGAKVRTLLDADKPAGYFSERWDGRNDAGTLVPTGIYFYRVQAGTNLVQKRMLLVK